MQGKHSKLGITSAAIGVITITGIIFFLLYINYYLNKSLTPDTIINAALGSIFMALVFIIILFTGFLLGIISLFQSNTKKFFGIVGVGLSVAGVILLIALIVMVTFASPGM